MKFFLLYILFINIFSFTLMLIDKKKARTKWLSPRPLRGINFTVLNLEIH